MYYDLKTNNINDLTVDTLSNLDILTSAEGEAFSIDPSHYEKKKKVCNNNFSDLIKCKG